MTFIHHIRVDFEFAFLHCVYNNGDFFVTRYYYIRIFLSIHFTVTLIGQKNIIHNKPGLINLFYLFIFIYLFATCM